MSTCRSGLERCDTAYEASAGEIVITASDASRARSSSHSNVEISKRDSVKPKFVSCCGRLECMS